MGYYNVIAPCVVGKLHYARPTVQPIEVDDDVAAPLVAAGNLTPYRPGGIEGQTGDVLDDAAVTLVSEEHPTTWQALASEPAESADEPEPEPKPRRTPRKRVESE